MPPKRMELAKSPKKPQHASVRRKTIERRRKLLESMDKSLKSKDKSLKSKDKLLKSKDKSLESIDRLLKSKDKLIQSLASQSGDELLFMKHVLPRNPRSAEFKLVKAAFQVANGFISHPTAHRFLFDIGERANSSTINPRSAVFLDPYESFKAYPKESRYAYSWIDQSLHGQSTIVFDQGFLTRYQALADEPESNTEAEYEMNLIEGFLGMKAAHEEGHFAIRKTLPERIVNDRTPPSVNCGETGDYLEANLFGGTTGFIFKGKGQWNGSQQIIGLHVNGVMISKKYIRGLVKECKKQEPNTDQILPMVTSRRKYVPPKDVRIMSTGRSTDAQMDIVSLSRDIVLVPGGLCGVRFLGLKPKKLALDSVAEPSASQGQEGLPANRRRKTQLAVKADTR